MDENERGGDREREKREERARGNGTVRHVAKFRPPAVDRQADMGDG